MKRPPGLWVLLSAGVLWLSMQDVYGIRATSLIFGKSSTTTTTTTTAASDSSSNEAVTEISTEATSNVTKPTLTGIPQIDYIWDPNLPKELNGYNLSEYPFYERVPEDIDFKCDGLHDGFYASVPHKCQVYHHCLFGTRYDFLCANYTAFDQKTFICHFVSEVDCIHSKKYWHRNDALYQAASTTTVKPVIIYTPPPTQPPDAPPANPRRRGGGMRRRPYRPRRPQYDYYDDEQDDDDYYDDRYRPKGRRNKRPRPRPRPVYDDEYDDYEDDRYEPRGSGRRNEDRKRKNNNRRGFNDRRRNNDRAKYDDEEDYPPEGEDSKLDNRDKDRRNNNKYDDDRREDDRRNDDRRNDDRRNDDRRNDDRRSDERRNDDRRNDDRRSDDRRNDDRRNDDKRNDDRRNDDRRNDDRHNDDKRSTERKYNKRRPLDDSSTEDTDRRRDRPKQGSRKPTVDDYEDELPQNDDNKSPEPTTDRPLIKPLSGTIYDRPRAAPKIKPPVPKSEANKYAYKPIATKTAAGVLQDEEYYDDYEEEPLVKQSKDTRKQETNDSRRYSKPSGSGRDDSRDTRKPLPAASRQRPQSRDELYEDESSKRSLNSRTKYWNNFRNRNKNESNNQKQPAEEEYYDDYEEEETKDSKQLNKVTRNRDNKERPTTTTSTTTTTTSTTTTAPTTTTTKDNPRERGENIVRIVKRPFLPSRGGNPYSARGLQPVGLKALDKKTNEEIDHADENDKKQEISTRQKPESKLNENPEQSSNVEFPEKSPETKPIFKPSPVIIKVPIRQKYVPNSEGVQQDDDAISSRAQSQIRQNIKPNKEYNGPRTTQKPKIIEKDPLDINENEYDVTLNDALNPTLPNLPVRSFPTGFSAANDYTYSSFQRPRYVIDPVLNPASSDYVYQTKPLRQRYETVPQTYSNSQEHFVNSNADYKGQYSTITAQIRDGQTYRPRAHLQTYYTTY